MIFMKSDKIYAKVWAVDRKEKYTEVRLSTSEKKRDSGEYINSNWPFVRFVGHAHNSARQLGAGDRIVITQAKLSNESYTDKNGDKKNAFRFVVMEYEVNEASTAKGGTVSAKQITQDDDLPY